MTNTMRSLETSPSYLEMATTDTLPIGFDTSALLEDDQSPSNAVVTLINILTNHPITLEDSPSIDGNVITQIVRGTELVAGQRYRIVWVFTAAENVVWTEVTTLVVPL